MVTTNHYNQHNRYYHHNRTTIVGTIACVLPIMFLMIGRHGVGRAIKNKSLGEVYMPQELTSLLWKLKR